MLYYNLKQINFLYNDQAYNFFPNLELQLLQLQMIYLLACILFKNIKKKFDIGLINNFILNMQHGQSIQTEKKMFPTLKNSIINKQFVGLGHLLEQKRRQRKKIEEQQRMIQNRVLMLEKEHHRTNKQIEEKQKHITQILKLKKRQFQQKKQRQRYQLQKQEQLQRLKQNSKSFRFNNLQKKQEVLEDLRQQKKLEFIEGKQGRKQRQSLKQHYLFKDLEQRQGVARYIYQKKQFGKQNVINFHKQKNLQHIDQYNHRMQLQQERKKRRQDSIQELQKKQLYLINKLEQSSQQHKKLQQTLSKAPDLNLNQLEKIIAQRSLKYSRSRQSSRLSLTDDHLQKNRSAGSIQKQKKQLPKLNLEQYKKRIEEIASVKVNQKVQNQKNKNQSINDSIENSQNDKKNKKKKRKRNKDQNKSKQ